MQEYNNKNQEKRPSSKIKIHPVPFTSGEKEKKISINTKPSKEQINHKSYDQKFYNRQIDGSLKVQKSI